VQFKMGGYIIFVYFLNNASAEEAVTRADYKVGSKSMTQTEFKTLLEAYAQGHTWKEVIKGSKWVRDDGAIAGGTLNFGIKSKELIKAEANAQKLATPSLKGF